MISDEELEAERRATLAEMRESAQSSGETRSLESRYGPESFGCHEALNLTFLVLGLIDRELANHGAIILNPDWFRRVRRIQDELWAVYQDIGAVHLVEPKSPPSG